MKKVRADMRPTVNLTSDDARELRALSHDLERELMRTYEDFVYNSDRRVDESRWKHIRSQEDMHIYRERDAYKQGIRNNLKAVQVPGLRGYDDHSHTLEIGPQAALAANSKMPVLLGTGILSGSMDDALYGTAFYDTRSLRARNSYAKQTMEETAVLAVIDGATDDDPFRFTGVVWFYKVFPVPTLLSSRDMVMLASIHSSQLSNGERVGVVLYHSIPHRDAPVRQDLHILRSEVSVAQIFRQLDDLRFEVFMSSFVDAKSASPETLLFDEAARLLLTVTHMGDVALRRKLLYRMRENQKSRQRTPSQTSNDTANSNDDSDDKECALCSKSFTGLFSPSGSNCQICNQRVCAKCSVTKSIVVESHRTAYTAMPFDFCLVCTIDTKEIAAKTIARGELHERLLAPRNPLSSSLSSSSTGSV